MNTAHKKALIIGIDGLSYDLLQDMLRKDLMPGVKDILDSGYRLRKMKASFPDVSSVSWTSFMTGVNPGMHGIYGFTQLMPSSYSLCFPDSTYIKAPTFWQTLRSRRKIGKTVVLNLPNTYPAFPVDGLLVSGFVAIDFNRAVYPPSYIPLLKRMDYIIDVDLEKARTDRDGFHGDLVSSLGARGKVALGLLKQEAWDIFILCVTETDRLHHFSLDKKEVPFFGAFYRRLDELITAIYEAARKKFGDDLLFLMLSDHGFVALDREVNLNACLKNAGFLKLDDRNEYYEKIAPGTIAFAMDPGRIFIHYEGKFPRGHIKEREGGRIKEELRELFGGLKDKNGAGVIGRIFGKEEVYHGPFTGDAPDLLLVPNDGFDLKGNLRKDDVFTTDIFTGMHSWHNAIFIAPEYIETPVDINIEHPAGVVIDYFS